MMLLEERKKKLAAEGLFDEARKQLLPFLPTVVGVVTSPTGAVIRDILHRLADRFPRQVLVWPVRVQGEGAAAEIAAAIEGFNALPEDGPIPRPDILIVARGGGSLEDLWCFNEEIVVRAAAGSMIPLISAVGHETDITLIDFASDQRAPTPTAAAEMAVPVRSELLMRIATQARRVTACWLRGQEGRRTELRAAARALPSLDNLLAIPRQRLDAASDRLPRALRTNAHVHHRQFERIAGRLAPQLLRTRLVRCQEWIATLTQRGALSREVYFERRRSRVDIRRQASQCLLLSCGAEPRLRARSRRQGLPVARGIGGHARHVARHRVCGWSRRRHGGQGATRKSQDARRAGGAGQPVRLRPVGVFCRRRTS